MDKGIEDLGLILTGRKPGEAGDFAQGIVVEAKRDFGRLGHIFFSFKFNHFIYQNIVEYIRILNSIY